MTTLTPVVICVLFLAALGAQQLVFNSERREWARERQLLLTRIQAPEIAVAENAKTDRKPVPTIPYDDDAAFHEARKAMNGRGD